MNQGVLYRYVPDADSAEAQLVIPNAERESIMQRHHNDPMAGHYGEDGTFQKIAKRYYWTGMKKYISDYIKKCPECAHFKATNQKPAGLLRTPVYSQRFEVIAIDSFGPLPQTDSDDVVQDFKSVVHNDNFVAEITPYLKRFATITEDKRERIETKQDQRKKQYDKNRRPVYYSPGDKVWVLLHPFSNAKNKKASKFMPKRDGLYLILTQKSTTSYVILHFEKEAENEKLRPLQHKIHMFQARQLLQHLFPAEPSISQQKLLLQQLILLILSPRRDVVGSIGGDCNPRCLDSSHINSRETVAPSGGQNNLQ
ncbi:transposon Tf2-6 polyprotein [Trichonephila clavipes]|nr:transposon Tf2-6 polyprotein [Trichonephila clavipes]